jgi:hypothetical protein
MIRIMTQLSVHMENRPGALADLTGVLLDEGVNILAIAVPDTGEFGTVRLLPDDVDAGRAALQDAGRPHTAVDVLAIELPHRPGALGRAARLLADEKITVHYAFCTNLNGLERALCIMRVDDIHKAKRVLDRKLA